MNRLQKCVEQGEDGEWPRRTAYALSPGNLAKPGKDMEWKPLSSFGAAGVVLAACFKR
jgi:hypothetical protein